MFPPASQVQLYGMQPPYSTTTLPPGMTYPAQIYTASSMSHYQQDTLPNPAAADSRDLLMTASTYHSPSSDEPFSSHSLRSYMPGFNHGAAWHGNDAAALYCGHSSVLH
jgi:hypothetical protein